MAGDAGKNRGVILAAAVRSDTRVSIKAAKRGAVLDACVIARSVLRTGDICLPFRTPIDAADPHQRIRDSDQEGARTAHTRRSRQIARNHDLSTQRRPRKIPFEASYDDVDIVPPAGLSSLGGRRRGLQADLLGAARIDDVHHAVGSRRRQHGEPSRHGGYQRAAACVVGVLSEHFQSAGNPPGMSVSLPPQPGVRQHEIEQCGLCRDLLRGEPVASQ